MIDLELGGPGVVLDDATIEQHLREMLRSAGALRRVLIIPPDFTRYHSHAGRITVMLHDILREAKTEITILPALGTHVPMTPAQIDTMFPGIPHGLFRVHDWRGDLRHLGDVPASAIREWSEGRLDWPVRSEVNRALTDEPWDLILSVGQVVPHEVIGMANYNKNIFTGVGGSDTINKTHFLGAVHGMERMMGRVDTPVRAVFDYMTDNFARDWPIAYIHTVRAKDDEGRLVTRGLFSGRDRRCFEAAARLAQVVNLDLLDKPIVKAVVYLDAGEYQSTWLGNKAIYRTRLAMADEGELIIIAPGVRHFGEDAEIDRLIRCYGYRGTPTTLKQVDENEELRENLSAAAHLIHGSSEGRFRITYCAGGLSRAEVEAVGFEHGNLDDAMRRYPVEQLRDGLQTMPDGEEIFFISNPALGLWALKSQFAEGGA